MKKKLLTLALLIAISVTNLGCNSGNTASASIEASASTEDISTNDNTSSVTTDTSDTTADTSVETPSPLGSFEPTPYDNSTLEGILTSIQADYSNTIENLLTCMEETNAIAGISYEDYKANKQLVTDWYALAITEEAALFARIKERAMDDLYDTYYGGVVDDGYDCDPYKTWSEKCSECYQAWSETSSAIYKAWSATSSSLYRQYSCISSGLYRGDYDVDSIWADYQKKLAMEEAEKALEATAETAATLEESMDTTTTDSSKDTTSSANNESAEGIRPEFLVAMDEYEAFFDEYIAFVQIYQASSPDDAVLMIEEYSEYMTQYVETMKSFADISSEEMTTEEALYYAEVSSRITAKLLEIQ